MIRHHEQEPIQQAAACADQQIGLSPVSSKRVANVPNATTARGIAAMVGLDMRAVLLATVVDAMLFGADVLSVGTLIPVAIAASAALGFIVFRIQRIWHGDDRESALIKALVIGLLTAIPVPLTPFIAIPCGVLGTIKATRR